jgi:hypothetical protein
MVAELSRSPLRLPAALHPARQAAGSGRRRPRGTGSRLQCRPSRHPRCAAASSGDSSQGGSEADAQRLNRLLQGPQLITGAELRQLVLDKWGRSYDVRLQRRGQRMFVHIMWRFLEQQVRDRMVAACYGPVSALLDDRSGVWPALECAPCHLVCAPPPQSFPLTEEEYELQLEAVAEYLNLWQAQDTVRAGIRAASKRGPGYTGGGNARAISIPLGWWKGPAAGQGRSALRAATAVPPEAKWHDVLPSLRAGVDVGGMGRTDEWNSF